MYSAEQPPAACHCGGQLMATGVPTEYWRTCDDVTKAKYVQLWQSQSQKPAQGFEQSQSQGSAWQQASPQQTQQQMPSAPQVPNGATPSYPPVQPTDNDPRTNEEKIVSYLKSLHGMMGSISAKLGVMLFIIIAQFGIILYFIYRLWRDTGFFPSYF